MSSTIDSLTRLIFIEPVRQEQLTPEQMNWQQVGAVAGQAAQFLELGFSGAYMEQQLLTLACSASCPRPATFVNSESNIPKKARENPARDASATPEQAAAYLTEAPSGPVIDPAAVRAGEFVRMLGEHQGDAVWTQRFLRALGTEKTAEYFSDALSPGVFRYASDGEREKRLSTLRSSLIDLAHAHALNQSDMEALVAQWTDGHEINQFIATELFAEMPYHDGGLKNKFYEALLWRALGSDDDNANYMAALASRVLAATPPDNQAVRLQQLEESGNLPDFINKAMAGERRVNNLDGFDYLMMPGPPQDNLGGVDKLLMNIAYNDVRDGWAGGAPLTRDQYTRLRTDLFNTAAAAIYEHEDVAEAYSKNTTFKDGMASILMNGDDFASIMRSMLPEGVHNHEKTFGWQGRPVMENVLKMILFSKPPSDYASSLMNFFGERMNAMTSAINGSDEDFQRFTDDWHTGNGLNREDAASLMGQMIGMVGHSLDLAAADAEGDAEAKARIVGLAVDFASGALGAAAAEFTGPLGSLVLGSAGAYVGDKIKEKVKEDSIHGFTADLVEQYHIEPKDIIFNLHQEILDNLEAGADIFNSQFASALTMG